MVNGDLRDGLAAMIPRLRRFGLAITGSLVDADELVQDACERALRRSGQLRDMARLDAWMYGIMRHLWIDSVRARRLRRHDDLAAEPEQAGDDGRDVTERRLGLDAVRRCLGALPSDQRTVLTLVCVDGLSYRETAGVLGVPVGTVMSRLSRARVALHERLNEAPAARTETVVKLNANRPRTRPVQGMS